jgi:glycine dehydrogenase subunit 1
MTYLVHSEADRQRMLEIIGASGLKELFSTVPMELQLSRPPLAPGRSEQEARAYLEMLATTNRPAGPHSFLGAGCYQHFVPAAVRALALRADFATAYTPYQAEVSQGTLQTMYEFQTLVCELTGFDISNASLYDGPSALAEGALMALRLTGRSAVAISAGVHPEASLTVRTYAEGQSLEVQSLVLDPLNGTTRPVEALPETVGAVLVQQPNCLGIIEDLESLAAGAHAAGALLVVMHDPLTLGMVAPPARLGADIVVGDVQAFGNSMSFGGPSAGYLACRREYLRDIPGRLVGETLDADGHICYTLTLQAREQHIRRARATSNICSNQALSALAATIHLCLLGPEGLHELATLCLRRAHYLHERLCRLPGARAAVQGPFFYEFALRLPMPATVFADAMRAAGIDAGVPLIRLLRDPGADPAVASTWTDDEAGRILLVTVTEVNDRDHLERYEQAAEQVLASLGGIDG